MSILDEETESEGRAVAVSLDAARQKADLDQQITTAKSYPRSYKRFTDKCMSLATANEEIAAGMMYALPRGGKSIEGPSARMAEVIQHAWGNNQSGQRVIEEDDDMLSAEGVFYDLESNVRITVVVKRRITDKENRRFNSDMIAVTGAAACSIAHRNAVLKGVPKAFWQPIYLAARKVAVGDVKTLANKRADALGYLQKMGASAAQVFAALGVSGELDIDIEKLALLRASVEAIKSGESSIDASFPPVDTTRPQATTKGKPETKTPDKKAAAKKKAAAAPVKPKNPLTVDQQTSIKDKLKEESVQLNALLAKYQCGSLDEIPTAEYSTVMKTIDELSA